MINIILILLFHFVSDFLFQTREMGVKKSKSIKWLTIHVLVYSLSITLFWGVFFNWGVFFSVLILTFLTHWVTDFVTSRVSSYCYLKMLSYKENKVLENKWQYNFWGVIGLDQLIHGITLLMTYNYLIKTI